MPYSFLCKISFCIFFIFCTSKAFSQYDASSLDLDGDVSIWFDQQFGIDNTQLVLGTYQKIQLSVNSHPFFIDKYWIKGSLAYRGQKFQNINMRYDIFQDYVIITHPTNLTLSNQPIRLFNEELESFELEGHTFLNLSDLVEGKGIYESLFKGEKLHFVSKRVKEFAVESNSENAEYKTFDYYYIVRKNELNRIKNRKSFIKLYPDLKKEIKKFTISNGLSGNMKNEHSMIQLAKFCDSKLSFK